MARMRMTPARPHGRGDLFFDARLSPHRSLSQRGFLILMTAVGTVGFAAGLLFYLIGAWPVVGFLGLDVALIYLAFRINYRRARAYEIVRLSRDDLVIERVSHWGERHTWRAQPYWLQVLVDEPAEAQGRLVLRSHGRRVEIGGFLTPAERVDLARALRAALARARAACIPCAPSQA
jgi:uncharacterized membrane protein